MPPACPVEVHVEMAKFYVYLRERGFNVKTPPDPPVASSRFIPPIILSYERGSPRDKPVASIINLHQYFKESIQWLPIED